MWFRLGKIVEDHIFLKLILISVCIIPDFCVTLCYFQDISHYMNILILLLLLLCYTCKWWCYSKAFYQFSTCVDVNSGTGIQLKAMQMSPFLSLILILKCKVYLCSTWSFVVSSYIMFSLPLLEQRSLYQTRPWYLS